MEHIWSHLKHKYEEMVLHMFHNHYETHFHFEVLPRNILSFRSFPKPLRNSNPDLRELTRFRGQVWFGIPGKFLLSFALRRYSICIWNIYLMYIYRVYNNLFWIVKISFFKFWIFHFPTMKFFSKYVFQNNETSISFVS